MGTQGAYPFVRPVTAHGLFGLLKRLLEAAAQQQPSHVTPSPSSPPQPSGDTCDGVAAFHDRVQVVETRLSEAVLFATASYREHAEHSPASR